MNKAEFDRYVSQGYNHIPVFKELSVDTDTALGLYLKLANTPYSYLFESVQGAEQWGRYSIIGLSAQTVVKVFDFTVHLEQNGAASEVQTVADPLVWIEAFQAQYRVPKLTELPDFNGGLVGYFGYEIIRYIEPKLAKLNNPDLLKVPDILLMVSNDLVILDNLRNTAFLMTHINPNQQTFEQAQTRLSEISAQIYQPTEHFHYSSDASKLDFKSQFGEQNFKQTVQKIQQYITQGDVMQVVPSQRLSCPFSAPPIELYRQLRRLNPSPYMYYLNLDDFYVVGSSPEILTRVIHNKATVRPMAGTRPRGKTPAQDLANEKELLADKKELAEHLMLIDLGRNDLGRIAKIGSVTLTKKMFVERYSHVMHIVSNVECDLQDDMSAIDVLRATFPAGTLSGAPKIRAMEIIHEVESVKRNIYAGAIGYLTWHGGMDMAIAIRTAVIKDEILYVQAGAGIVSDSVAQSEWDETMHKAQALMSAAQCVLDE